MTPIGLIEDIGTVFMVAIDGKDVEVAMREGTTRIHTAQGILTATGDREVGDVVRISAQAAITTTEPTSSTRWDWIHGAHPGYRETSVPLLLNAIANDLGRRLAYASPGVEASVQNLRIEGDISQLSPDEALRVVLATSGLTAVADGDHQLVIAFQSSANSQ
jgi:ferric-dicitrate binding protein FerR (iron transport regulator)